MQFLRERQTSQDPDSAAFAGYGFGDGGDAVANAQAANQAALAAAMSTLTQTANDLKAQVDAANDRLYAVASAVVVGKDDAVASWQAWHEWAVGWENQLTGIAAQLSDFAAKGILDDDSWQAMLALPLDPADPSGATVASAYGDSVPASSTSAISDWADQGKAILQDAASLASIWADSDLAGTLLTAAEDFPIAVQAAIQGLVNAAKNTGVAIVNASGDILSAVLDQAGAATKKAATDVAITLLLVVGAVAGGLWLLKKSGLTGSVSIPGAGSVGLKGFRGGFRGKRKKVEIEEDEDDED